ncbi:MAG: hypothetical protein LIO94_04300, partial [Clostridiales bacterium]|nr:hypothetical protein [Clostridiales bacterium]
MAFENNIPSISDYGTDGMRDISARRASTIANMIDEAKKEGRNEGFARKAISRFGSDNAESMRS